MISGWQRNERIQAVLQNGGSELDCRDASMRALRKALKKGLVSRPKKCPRCKAVPGVDAQGNPKIQAVHLNGYSPEHRFDFEWMCVSCRSRAVWAKKKSTECAVSEGVSRG